MKLTDVSGNIKHRSNCVCGRYKIHMIPDLTNAKFGVAQVPLSSQMLASEEQYAGNVFSLFFFFYFCCTLYVLYDCDIKYINIWVGFTVG